MTNEPNSLRFWIITNGHTVKRAIGYDCCDHPNVWYFPDHGFLSVNLRCFVNRGGAVAKVKESLSQLIGLYQGRLAELEN